MRLGLLDLPVALPLPPLGSSVLEPDLVVKRGPDQSAEIPNPGQRSSSCVERTVILFGFNQRKSFFIQTQPERFFPRHNHLIRYTFQLTLRDARVP